MRGSSWFDPSLALAVAAIGLAEVWVPLESRQGSGSPVVSSVGILLAAVALTQRRRHPLASGLVVLVIPLFLWLAAPGFVLFYGEFVPMAIAVFSMARHGRGRVPIYGGVAAAATLLAVDLFVEALQGLGEVVFHWGVFATVWAFGFGLRQFELRARESTDRAIAAEVASTERAMAAVVAERTRIARELHDIVAHSVSMMVVQAGAAEQVVDDDPAFVRQALGTVRTTGTGALAEMRRLVAMLRDDDDEPDLLGPQPGLAGLPALVEDTAASGIESTLTVHGRDRALPAGVDLAAYRIVQEALTNTRRHARADAVRVVLTYGEDALDIEVHDDGTGSGESRADGAGHGLVGMRERAVMYGGWVDAAPLGTGFRVRAHLPLAPGAGLGS